MYIFSYISTEISYCIDGFHRIIFVSKNMITTNIRYKDLNKLKTPHIIMRGELIHIYKYYRGYEVEGVILYLR